MEEQSSIVYLPPNLGVASNTKPFSYAAKPTPLKRQITPLATTLPFKSPQIPNPLASSYFTQLQNSLLHHFNASSVQKNTFKVVVTLLKLMRKNDNGNHLHLALIRQP